MAIIRAPIIECPHFKDARDYVECESKSVVFVNGVAGLDVFVQLMRICLSCAAGVGQDGIEVSGEIAAGSYGPPEPPLRLVKP